MRYFRNLSIQRKMTLIMVLISIATLLFAFAGFVAYDLYVQREKMAEDLAAAARTMGATIASSQEPPGLVLQTLSSNPHIISAALYTTKGEQKSRYVRSGAAANFPAVLQPDGDYISDFKLQIFQTSIHDRKNVGVIFIESDLEDIWGRLRDYLLIFTTLLLLAGLVSYFLSSRFQRLISEPILGLLDIERAVSTQKDYSVRAPKQSNDEVGLLIDGFNEMLAQIQNRDDELTLSKDYSNSIIGSMVDSLIVLDRNGNIRTVNKALTDLIGYSEKDLIGKTIGMFDAQKENVFPKANSRREMLGKLFKHGSIRDFEMTFETVHGRKIPMSCSGSVMKNVKGEIEGLVIIAKDITDRKQAESELHSAKDAAEEASRTKSAFLANMSHELRTPLNAIIGYSEMLQEEASDLQQDAFLPDLKKIHSAGKHLLSLINDILDLSKIEAGKMELFTEEFEINPLIEDVVTTIGPLVRKNNNELQLICPEDLGSMCTDVTRLRQVLFNLLSNACKFTERGKIQLSVERKDDYGVDWILFRVSDTGIGMTPDQLNKLFKAFTQAESSTSRKYGGTGLGLVISKRFSQMMGGDIEVASEYSKGTTFTVKIPAGKPEFDRAPTMILQDFRVSDVARHSASTVLVIDDDPGVRELVQRFLTKEGFYVVTASNGLDGLKLASELRPNAITLDVVMPEMDGWEVLKSLKGDPLLASIPVIMITVMENQKTGFALGVSDYLVKPIDYDRLARILRELKPLRQ